MNKKNGEFNFIPPASLKDQHNGKMNKAESTMINVGALVAYIVSYGASKGFETACILLKKASRRLKPTGHRIAVSVRSGVFAFCGRIADFARCMKVSFGKFGGRIKSVGLFHALKLQASDFVSAVKRSKSTLISAVNYAIPIAAFAVLASVVYNTASTSYGIAVEYNGQELGVVTAESVVADAQKTIADRAVYYDTEDEILVTANLSIKPINAYDEVIDEITLADKIEEQLVTTSGIEFSNIASSQEDDISVQEIAQDDTAEEEDNSSESENQDKVRAFAIEVDGELIGAVSSTEKIEAFLESKKAEYMDDDVVSVDFEKDIEYSYEQYVLPSQVVSEETVIEKLDSIVAEPVYYEVQQGDSPWNIAKYNGITLEELQNCFITFDGKQIEDITTYCPVGAIVRLSAEVPFLQVTVTKQVTYTASIDYDIVKTEDPDMYKGDKVVDVKGIEGEAEYTALITYKNGVAVSKEIIDENIISEPVTQEVRVGTRETTTEVSTGSGGSGDYFWPVGGGYISAYMGDGRGHKGLDIAAPYGTPIYAAESGTVTRAANKYDGYGNCVMISHSDGNVTLYAHMSSIAISYGDYVVKGQLIGYVGATGDASGNHCHFEVRSGGYYLNPLDYVSQY